MFLTVYSINTIDLDVSNKIVNLNKNSNNIFKYNTNEVKTTFELKLFKLLNRLFAHYPTLSSRIYKNDDAILKNVIKNSKKNKKKGK